MKTLITFIFCLLTGPLSLAQNRLFDCLSNSVFFTKDYPEEIEFLKNPRVLFRDGNNWFFDVGSLSLESFNSHGPALKKEETSTENQITYHFYVDGSYEYEFEVNTNRPYKAKLYWWGRGDRFHLADLTCEIDVY